MKFISKKIFSHAFSRCYDVETNEFFLERKEQRITSKTMSYEYKL
jgi:hypothetical protein